MSVTFHSEKVEAHHYMNLANSNASALIAVAGLNKYDDCGCGKVSLEALPAILHNIEEALSNSNQVKPYVRAPVDEQSVTIVTRSNSNVVRVKRGPYVYDPGIDEAYLYRKLARLYILTTAALDAGSDLEWF